MNWKTFPENKPNYGDIIAIRTAPEQGSSYRVTPFFEHTDWIDGDQWLKLNGVKRKPLSDNSLPLTKEELEEFSGIIGVDVKAISFKGGLLWINKGTDRLSEEYLVGVKAILWLNERFDLTEK
jgi:hypothetical protein